MNTITIAKDILSEFTIGSVGDMDDGWEIKEHTITGQWRHGNTYRLVLHHPDHGYFGFNWQDQQNGEWSSFDDEPGPVELYRVVARAVTVTKYDRVTS